MSKNANSVTKNHKQYEVDHYSGYYCMIINFSVGHYSVGHYMTIYLVEHDEVERYLIIKCVVDFYLGCCLKRMITGAGEKEEIAEIEKNRLKHLNIWLLLSKSEVESIHR